MLRVLEKAAGHHARFELIAQHVDKIGYSARSQPRKHSCAEPAGLALQFRLVCKERIDLRTICLQQRVGAIANAIEVVERNHPEPLRWMQGASISEVDNLHIRCTSSGCASIHPQQMSLGPYAFVRLLVMMNRPKVKCRTPWLVEQSLEVDLVHQDSRS
jgi:hypothetical protein